MCLRDLKWSGISCSHSLNFVFSSTLKSLRVGMCIMIQNIIKLFTKASKIRIYSVKISKRKIFDTVKPLYGGHHLDLEKMPAIERCPLHRGLSEIGLFCFENPL